MLKKADNGKQTEKVCPKYVISILLGMAFPVVEFLRQGYKIRKVFA